MPALYNLPALTGFTADAGRFLLPCPFKYVTGYDCPGCGFQRSLVALIQGRFQDSFQLYPATVLLLITASLTLLMRLSGKTYRSVFFKALILATGWVIVISYVYKISSGHLH